MDFADALFALQDGADQRYNRKATYDEIVSYAHELNRHLLAVDDDEVAQAVRMIVVGTTDPEENGLATS